MMTLKTMRAAAVLLVIGTGSGLAACTSETAAPESVTSAPEELLLDGTTWPSGSASVCFDGIDGNNSTLLDEAKRLLEATWGRAAQITFPGRATNDTLQANWAECNYGLRVNGGNFSMIAVHFCDGNTARPYCPETSYAKICTAGLCVTDAECGSNGTCTGGVCTSGSCDDDRDCGSFAPQDSCRGVRKPNAFRGGTSNRGPARPTPGFMGYFPGITHVSLIGDNTSSFRTAFRYQVIHEFGHALGFRHEQDRDDNQGQCDEDIADEPSTGDPLTFFDNNSIMSYCASDPLQSALTKLGGGDILGVRQVYGRLSSAHGFMIVSDADQGLAVNAEGGARPNGKLNLQNNCNTGKPDCTWTFQRGMLVSDKDPTLAIKRIKDCATCGSYLRLVRAGLRNHAGTAPANQVVCTPDDANCTWTYKLGQFELDADRTYHLNARGGATHGAEVGVSPSCTPTNGSCLWTLPNVMLTSERNIALPINARGGAIDKAPLYLHKTCDTTNSSCTFTFSRGMIKTTGNTALAWNAFGGAREGADILINSSCSQNNRSCTWEWSGGRIKSDDEGAGRFYLSAPGGAFHLTRLKLTSACAPTANPPSPDCLFNGSFAKH